MDWSQLWQVASAPDNLKIFTASVGSQSILSPSSTVAALLTTLLDEFLCEPEDEDDLGVPELYFSPSSFEPILCNLLT